MNGEIVRKWMKLMIDFQNNLTPQELRYCENDVKATYEAYKFRKVYERKQRLKKVLCYIIAGLVVAILFWLMLKGV